MSLFPEPQMNHWRSLVSAVPAAAVLLGAVAEGGEGLLDDLYRQRLDTAPVWLALPRLPLRRSP